MSDSGAAAGHSSLLDRLFMVIGLSATICVLLPFVWIIGDIVWHGAAEIDWQYLTSAPRDAGRGGGVLPIMVSTVIVLAVTLITAIPIALATAIGLVQPVSDQSWLARFTRCMLDLLAAVPSIVFGLFGNAFFCVTLGMGYSLLAGGLTLACMILPTLTRLIESSLRAVPDSYQEAAAGLGLSEPTTFFRVIWPSALPGVVSAIVLSLGRAIAETAALLYTSGYATRMPSSLMSSGRTLSVHVYDMAMNVAGGNPRAFAASIMLMMVFLSLYAVGSSLGVRKLGDRLNKV